MPTRSLIVSSVTALAIAWDVAQYRRIRKAARKVSAHNDMLIIKFNELVDERNNLARDLSESNAQINYLLHVLTENNVITTEFDRIAYRNLRPE